MRTVLHLKGKRSDSFFLSVEVDEGGRGRHNRKRVGFEGELTRDGHRSGL